jgi:hypothetical protein
MKKRVLVGVGVAAVAGVLLWPRHPKKDATLEPVTPPPAPAAGSSAPHHPRPVMDDARRRQVEALGQRIDLGHGEDAVGGPDDPPVVLAKTKFQEGVELTHTQRYAEAAEAFLIAYDSVPFPGFLWRASAAYGDAGDCAHALEYLDRFIAEADPANVSNDTKDGAAALRKRCGAPP